MLVAESSPSEHLRRSSVGRREPSDVSCCFASAWRRRRTMAARVRGCAAGTSLAIRTNVTSFSEERVSLRDFLVRATSDLHGRLDRALGAALVDRFALAAFLRASRATIGGLAPSLIRAEVWKTFDAALRRRAIELDLEHLGAPISPAPAEPLPWIPSTVAEAYGCAYVVEGSALGGLALAKQLGPRLGLTPDAMRYLALRGPDTMMKWRAFLSELEGFGGRASERERRSATAAAQSTFEAYAAAFEREGLLQWSM